ncbi:histidinol-phosphatase [Chengkuizengella axinellae]|uniref:Histidinol-phosphatase n=1 Tax=Chengkuizengella axinellae TaxID=3064388 RepID=A0ABT9IUW6_9BACL|nr:histidinol-phosphatase [Chengkuizengella sp. 2205SS18-9]MDP5272625.1 histidinol-phosphatase [Chengkuizengella sp. 2205SS18-9]
MKFDLHTHHYRCGHAEGTIEDYIKEAIEKGMKVIGISDHSPYFAHSKDQAEPKIAMAKSEFPNYVNEILKLKKKYLGQIEVLLGIESDFFPEYAHLYQKEYEKYPFDYIIGSIHRVNGVSIFNKKRWHGLSDQEKVEQKDQYYELIQQSARSGMFQILGHIDAMKGYYPEFSNIQTESIDETLKVVAECEAAIEINTSGKTKDVGGWYPSDDILEKALFYGVYVTFGSDAHVPDRVGDEWDLVAARLKKIGYKEWVYFKEKRRVSVEL